MYVCVEAVQWFVLRYHFELAEYIFSFNFYKVMPVLCEVALAIT